MTTNNSFLSSALLFFIVLTIWLNIEHCVIFINIVDLVSYKWIEIKKLLHLFRNKKMYCQRPLIFDKNVNWIMKGTIFLSIIYIITLKYIIILKTYNFIHKKVKLSSKIAIRRKEIRKIILYYTHRNGIWL